MDNVYYYVTIEILPLICAALLHIVTVKRTTYSLGSRASYQRYTSAEVLLIIQPDVDQDLESIYISSPFIEIHVSTFRPFYRRSKKLTKTHANAHKYYFLAYVYAL